MNISLEGQFSIFPKHLTDMWESITKIQGKLSESQKLSLSLLLRDLFIHLIFQI